MIAAIVLQLATLNLPYPWLEACYRDRPAGCEVAHIAPVDLAYVNKLVSETLAPELTPAPDAPWIAFPVDRRGDCKANVMTKRAALIALGLPASAMTIELGEVTYDDGHRENHAVLWVALDGKTWALDNLTPDRIYTADARPYQWRRIALQDHAGVPWIASEISNEPAPAAGR
jgi:predicted transglutaminase-like cysteine proteinase